MDIKKESFLDWSVPAFSNFKVKIIPLIFFTPVRAAVIAVAPIFIWLVRRFVRIELNRSTQLLLSFLVLSAIYGILNDTNDISNALLGLFIEVPIVYLFFTDYTKIEDNDYTGFIKGCTWVLVVIDLLGFYTFFFYHVRGEDSFGIPYGQHFTSVHGLSLMNVIMFIFYTFNNFYRQFLTNKLLAAFFFISFVMCFYGLGVVCLGIALGIYALTYLNLKKIIGLGIFVAIAAYVVMNTNSQNVTYVENKIQDSYSYDYLQDAPRKVQFAAKAYDRFGELPPLDYVFGLGPGAYNGRIAFLLNNDATNPFTEVAGYHMPIYHETDVWPYWNSSFVSMIKYTDGTINKPHSSVISVIMENGVPFALLFFFLWGRRMFRLFINRSQGVYTSMFLIHLFFFFNFITEQWFETSEFLFFAIFSGVNLAYSRNLINDEKTIITS